MTATRAAAAAATIRQSILSGRYISGERLVEVKIAQTLNVSQNTIRDALHLLEQEGWVVKQARHGVYVRSFSAEDALEICALVEVLETLALGWAKFDKAVRADLHERIAAARKLAYTDRRHEAFEQLLHFHQRIVIAAGRPLTLHLLETLYNQVRLLEALRQARAPRAVHEVEQQIAAHAAIYEALEANDLDAARRALHAQIADYSTATAAALRL